jgi:hypothetical protein
MAGKKKAAVKKEAPKPGIEDRYKKELPPRWSAKYKAMIMAGLIKDK